MTRRSLLVGMVTAIATIAQPGEDQVDVMLTRGFWMAKYETTQGLWTRVAGSLAGPLTKELPAGEDLPGITGVCPVAPIPISTLPRPLPNGANTV